jgi:hypothetical protein
MPQPSAQVEKAAKVSASPAPRCAITSGASASASQPASVAMSSGSGAMRPGRIEGAASRPAALICSQSTSRGIDR